MRKVIAEYLRACGSHLEAGWVEKLPRTIAEIKRKTKQLRSLRRRLGDK